MGEMYHLGHGLPASQLLAYKWVYMAAQGQNKAAKQLLMLLDMTTPVQIRQEAVELAADEKTTFLCGTPFVMAQKEDAEARARDKSPHPVIDWNLLLKSALR